MDRRAPLKTKRRTDEISTAPADAEIALACRAISPPEPPPPPPEYLLPPVAPAPDALIEPEGISAIEPPATRYTAPPPSPPTPPAESPLPPFWPRHPPRSVAGRDVDAAVGSPRFVAVPLPGPPSPPIDPNEAPAPPPANPATFEGCGAVVYVSQSLAFAPGPTTPPRWLATSSLAATVIESVATRTSGRRPVTVTADVIEIVRAVMMHASG